MAHKFNDDEKKVQEFAERMPFGVSKVQLVFAEADHTEAGKEFIKLTVANEAGIEDSAMLWFVGGAANISFNTLRQIAVHSGKDEAQKQKIGEAIDAVEDTESLCALFNEKLIGAELWFTKYYDPKRTYQNSAGYTKKSINNNVYGYEPKLKPELMPQDESQGSGNQALDDLTAGGESVDASEIPGDDAWSK
jgi:hypothetical protein